MKVDLSIWEKLTRVVIFLLFIAGILLVAIWYLPLIKENERYRQKFLRLDTVIQKEEETGKQLRTSIYALRRDPKAVERLARETGLRQDRGNRYPLRAAADQQYLARKLRRQFERGGTDLAPATPS